MAIATLDSQTKDWPHKPQCSGLESETTQVAAEIPTTRVTSGQVYEAVMKLRAVLANPEKHPETEIIYAKNS